MGESVDEEKAGFEILFYGLLPPFSLIHPPFLLEDS